jgi:hypothetical membrane protein
MIRFAGLGGVIGAMMFTVTTIIAASLRPEYNHMASFISELGADGTSNAAFMNVTGFLPAGLLLSLVGVAIARTLPTSRAAAVGTALVALFGVGVLASGLISCDAGCPRVAGSLENIVHNLIGPFAFICATCGIGVLGAAFRSIPEWRSLSGYSLVSSGAALVFLILLISSVESRVRMGLYQRLFLATVFIWYAIAGMRAYRLQKEQRVHVITADPRAQIP